MTPLRATPDEGAIAEALGTLGAASSVEQVQSGTAALAAGMAFERYVVLDVRGGGGVTGLLHNAPIGIAAQLTDVDQLTADSVVSRARGSRLPFVWGSTDVPAGPYFQANADAGYRSGLAASNWNGGSYGVVLLMSDSGEGIPDDDHVMLLGYASLAASQLLEAFERTRTLAAADGTPLTSRELDCLLYVLAGLSGKTTARALGIGTRTVAQYLERARIKLRAQTSYEAATMAVRRGLLDTQRAADLIESISAAARAR